MPKTDYIPRPDNDYLIWHDRFKTNVLLQAATFGLVAGDTTPITTDNTDIHLKVTNLNSTAAIAKPTLTGADQTGGVVELDFDKSLSDGVNLYGKRGTEPDFTFLARDTASPYVDNRALLAAGKPELREYKAVYVQSDEEIGLFSDEVVVNCAP